MGITINFTSISPTEIANRIISDDVKLFANNTLYKLCNDFVPMDSGALASTVSALPKNTRLSNQQVLEMGETSITAECIQYKAPYARRMYMGERFNFSIGEHPLATAHWDKAAMLSRRPNLVKSIQAYLDRGR